MDLVGSLLLEWRRGAAVAEYDLRAGPGILVIAMASASGCRTGGYETIAAAEAVFAHAGLSGFVVGFLLHHSSLGPSVIVVGLPRVQLGWL